MPPRWGCEIFLQANIYKHTVPLGLARKIRRGQQFPVGEYCCPSLSELKTADYIGFFEWLEI
jgi:hypothetical protein